MNPAPFEYFAPTDIEETYPLPAPSVAYCSPCPWATETWMREGLAHSSAHELELDTVELRRKNVLPKEEQPYKIAHGLTIERISVRETLEAPLKQHRCRAVRATRRR